MTVKERDLPLWLGGAAIFLIALGQMAVVLDALAIAHPSWPFAVHFLVAVGFELAVLSTGLAVMLTGSKWLAAGELALLAVSVACGWWTVLYHGSAPPRLLVAATLAWLPLQYLIATGALHKLYHRGQTRRAAAKPEQVPAATSPAQDRPSANGLRPSTVEAAIRAAETAAMIAANTGQDATAEQVAAELAVPVRTARRHLALARGLAEERAA